MRVTQNLIYDTYISDIMRKQESLYEINKQISTGKRVNSASDDPVNANNILSSKSILSSFGQYSRNADYGLSMLSGTETSLNSAKDAITRLQELATTAANGMANQDSRNSIKSEVDNIYKALLDIGNASYGDRYLFSGYKTDSQAFDSSGNYLGDANSQQIRISPSSTLTIGTNGGDVFKGASGGVDIFRTVSDFSTALAANDLAGIRGAIDGLASSFSQVSNAVSDIGGKVSRLNASKQDYSAFTLEIKSSISDMEDADITKLISDLNSGQVALQAALSSAGKVFSINIFDYLS